MRKLGTIILATSILIALCWCGVAWIRLSRAHATFAIAIQNPTNPEVESFFRSSSLKTWRSLRPLIKDPFRKDIRLYFAHSPMINADGVDAWASNERGFWEWKIGN